MKQSRPPGPRLLPGHARTGGRNVIFAWEQCKLGDVADITTGSRNHQDSVTDGKYPFFVRSDKVERLNEYDFDTRAILVPGDGRIGEIFHYYNGKFALHQRVYKVDNFNGINALFLLGQFKYSFKKHSLRLNAQGTVPSLRLPMFTNWNISIPNITEQERIGSFFRKLDRTITLHEEKKRQLERLKSALMQKMFANKNGYPAVRFEGFSNEWEHCKLGDVADITTGSRNHQDSVTDGKYPFFVRSDKVERLNEYDFDTKAILVPGDGRIGEIFHYYNGKFALHQRVYKVDNFNGINELFLLGLFKYSFKEHALRLNAQGTVPSLRLPMFTNWSISVPMITEQERIGVFFQKLERTISLYDHKLELLKKVKRSMLQAMFI
ncbi:restriction endonuclease subunit S [Lactobacillus delbrueckii subsp. bulgaricus]|nr:restriction endonuclease subunit S [Lactobacillus delbrueckii subsp. bulgaricus]MCT3494673.1 restriction endonuclease subunit S [Lactobacillus delbrueckii subsp. bulgaricus]MCT3496630.1 restriction endonuclease subunit S [Lactobacillus delbrueckii subsp. bulgaricus]